jgi:hypothetical protein
VKLASEIVKLCMLSTLLLLAPIKDAYSGYCKPIHNAPKDNLINSSAVEKQGMRAKTVAKEEILQTVSSITTSFEDRREFPDTVFCGGNSYPLQALFLLYSEMIISISNNTSPLFEIPGEITYAGNIYINMEPDSSLYSTPLTKDEYILLCGLIKQKLNSTFELPESFAFKNGLIRSAEVLYLLASVLRSYDFYGRLPQTAEIMITPKGLVPWNISNSNRKYTSMNNGWKYYYYQTNNFYNVGKYEVFNIAKKIIGGETDTYNAGNMLYNGVIDRWNNGSYCIWIKPFDEPDYAYTQWRFNRSNSASQFDKINMLLRSVGIPCTEYKMYEQISGCWININVHKPYGELVNAPDETNPTADFKEPLIKKSTIIQRIKEQIIKNDNIDIPNKYIWINAADIAKYGEDYILSKCKSGGVNNIIVTVKSSPGYFYYPTKYDRVVYGINKIFRYQYDAVSKIAEKASAYNIKILPALSILNDYFMAVASWNDIGMDSVKNWMQYPTENIDYKNPLSSFGISPCVSEFLDSAKKYIDEVANLPGVSGIVLSSLYFNTTSYGLSPDGNPNCKCYQNIPGWQGVLLNNYAKELITEIKNKNEKLKVILASYPLTFSYYPDLGGMLDVDVMKNLADEYLLIVGYSQWLNPAENYDKPVITPSPLNLEEYVRKISSGAQKPITVSISVKDEWIFPPEFYTGAAKGLRKSGASGICFHNNNSLEGEFGPAFDSFQYSVIGAMDFTKSVINSGGSISGRVFYSGNMEKPLNNISVKLKNTSTNEISNVKSDSSGFYSFSAAAGSYILTAESSGGWSGVNATDALLVMKYCIGEIPLSPLQLKAADVNMDGFVNATDAMLIARRSIGLINSFVLGDWVFDSAAISLSNDILVNINGLCTGDVNGNSVRKNFIKESIPLTIDEQITLDASKSEEIIPVKINKAAKIGAYTIQIKYPTDLIEIKKINCKNNNALFNVSDGMIKAVWYGARPLVLSADEKLFDICIRKISNEINRKVVLSIEPQTEFADTAGSIIKNLALTLSNTAIEIPQRYYLAQNYPNPFNPTTNIKYSIPVISRVKIAVYNILGQQVKLLKEGIESGGFKEVAFEASNLSSGFYLCILAAEAVDGSHHYQAVKKLILLK